MNLIRVSYWRTLNLHFSHVFWAVSNLYLVWFAGEINAAHSLFQHELRLFVSPVEAACSLALAFFFSSSSSRGRNINSSFLHQEMQILVVIPLRSVFLTVNAGLPVPITGAARWSVRNGGPVGRWTRGLGCHKTSAADGMGTRCWHECHSSKREGRGRERERERERGERRGEGRAEQQRRDRERERDRFQLFSF